MSRRAIDVPICPECGADEYAPPTDCAYCEGGGGLVSERYVAVDALLDQATIEEAVFKALIMDHYVVDLTAEPRGEERETYARSVARQVIEAAIEAAGR